ncbi:jg22156 [Pararge aegeria aegeria]|uniref:Jg22156 protein n=1 Tax=Pararge aegeria aegeria TaxID=348720 RepID=A0A8S4QF08_9NEOP|nr:jg22156 [Pararge aegeria aegeria]
MEIPMLGVSLRDIIRNEKIRRRTRVTDIAQRPADLKWQWMGHLVRRNDECCGPGCSTGKRSVSSAPNEVTVDMSLGAALIKRPRTVDFGTLYHVDVKRSKE